MSQRPSRTERDACTRYYVKHASPVRRLEFYCHQYFFEVLRIISDLFEIRFLPTFP